MVRTKVGGLLVALALSASAGTIRAQESLSSAQGLMIVRVVISIETGISPRVNGSIEWRNLAEVMKLASDPHSTVYLRDLSTAKMVDSSTATVLDYTLQLTRTDDKQDFHVSLTPTAHRAPKEDRLAWFTDARGVIYAGKPIEPATRR
jgi:hypothetical protein